MTENTMTEIESYERTARSMLNGQIAAAARETAEFVEAVAKHGPSYAVSWASSTLVADEAGRLAAEVLRIAERRPFAEALAAVVDETTRALLTNRHRGSSTSALSNASEAAKAEAASRFVQMFAAVLSEIR